MPKGSPGQPPDDRKELEEISREVSHVTPGLFFRLVALIISSIIIVIIIIMLTLILLIIVDLVVLVVVIAVRTATAHIVEAWRNASCCLAGFLKSSQGHPPPLDAVCRMHPWRHPNCMTVHSTWMSYTNNDMPDTNGCRRMPKTARCQNFSKT